MSRPKIIGTLRVYSTPVLKNNSELYIEYYVIDPINNGEEKRKRMRLNHLGGTVTQRLKEANRIRRNLENKLESGWNPFLDENNPKSYTKFSQVFEEFNKIRDGEFRDATKGSYKSFFGVLQKWILETYKKDMYVVAFKRPNAVAFLNYVLIVRDVSNTTYNNYLIAMKAFFTWLIDQGFISHNPFTGIKPRPESIKKRMYINPEQQLRIKTEFTKLNKHFFELCSFSYHTLTRRKEITFIQVKHIDLEKKLLYTEEYFTKNKRNSYVTLNNSTIEYFEKIGLKALPKHYYVFSDDFQPGHKMLKPKKITDTFTKFRKEINLPSNIQFMSLRDTGIRNLLRQNVPIDEVSKHARHSGIEITQTYLFHDEVVAHEKIMTANDF